MAKQSIPLSEYIRRLRVIARQLKKEHGIDPHVCIRRCSDYTDKIDSSEASITDYTGKVHEWPAETYPRVVNLMTVEGAAGEWLLTPHPSMTEAQKSKLRAFVELAPGN
jgi:hypothetical protein